MKRYITLVIMMAMIAIVPANANFWQALGRIAKNFVVGASAAVVEQTCEHAGYSKEEARKATEDLFSALGANSTNVQRGLDYINASDKYEKQNVIKDYAFDLAGDVSGNYQMVESFRTLTDANLEYLHDKTTATNDTERRTILKN